MESANTAGESDRYTRQEFFAPIGKEGQEKLANARVALIGCGALGSHIAQHLVRAGVGFIRLCDRDFVELNNLQRQVLYDESDAEQKLPKVIAAKKRLQMINSEIELEARFEDVHSENILDLIEGVDLVLDGTDNFLTRFLINDACLETNTSWVYGGCVGAHGMLLSLRPGSGPCFRCAVPDLPAPGSSPSCESAGVLGPAIGVVASLQSAEAIKFLVGDTDAIRDHLLMIDLWRNDFREIKLPQDPECKACAKREFDFLHHRDHGETSTVLCGRNAVQITPTKRAQIDLDATHKQLSQLGTVKLNDFVLRFTRDDLEALLFPDGRALIKGTGEESVARAFYAKYIGC